MVIAETVLVPLSILSVGHLFLSLTGRAIVPYQGKLQAYILSLLVGLCLLSVIPYGLNLAQLDVRAFFWTFYIVGIVYAILLGVRVISRSKYSVPSNPFGKEERISEITILGIAALAVASLIFLSALNQGSDWDAIQLYLPMGKIVFQNGILPAFSPQIGRGIVNFFLLGYVYGFAMTVSGNFLYPPAIIGIVSISLLGLTGVTYEISSLFLHALSDRLLAATYLLTLPLMGYYFAWLPHYADIPSVFLAFGLALLVFNCIRGKPVRRWTIIIRNLTVGIIAFAVIGYKLQNLFILPLLVVLLFDSASTDRRRLLAFGVLLAGFTLSVTFESVYGTVFGGLSASGVQSPVVIIVGESVALLVLFCIVFLKKLDHLQSPGLWSILPGSLLGLVLWFLRPTLVASTPFFPITLPGRPEFAFAKETYASVVVSLFSSPLTQYGAVVPYTSPYLSALLLPAILLGAYSFLRRNQTFVLKWLLLSVAAATIVTAYVDPRYALWVSPLSGILVGESTSFLRNKFESSFQGISLLPLVLMPIGLAMFHGNPTIYPQLLLLSLAFGTVVAAYSVIVLSTPKRLIAFARKISPRRFHIGLYPTILMASLCVSLFSFTYVSLIVEDQKSQAQQSIYAEVYVFLEQNVTRGSTVLSIGFPGIYYNTGLNSVPLDDPEGLARLYTYAKEGNASAAAIQLSSDMHATSIIVPTEQNGFWYAYFIGLRNRVPLVTALTSQPVSHLGFATSLYNVYVIS